MSTAGRYPYPDDHPDDIRAFARALLSAAEAVTDVERAVEDTRACLGQRWHSPAGTRAVLEVDIVAAECHGAARMLAGGRGCLDDYARVLEEARTTIDEIRAAHDAAGADHAAAVGAVDGSDLDPGAATALRIAAGEARIAREDDLAARFDDVAATVAAAATAAGAALTEIAGVISPAPASLDADLVRAGMLDRLPFLAPPDTVTVVRTGDHLLVTTGDGDDDVRIRRDPTTGLVTVTVNGVPYAFEAGDADDIVVRTSGGDDVIEVEPGVTLGFVLLGGTGDDLVAGAGGADVIATGRGFDSVIGGAGDDVVDAGGEDDVVLDELGLVAAVALAGRHPGRIVATRGGGGRDLVVGGRGNDLVDAGEGDDEVWAGGGDDRVDTGAGHDRVFGQEGVDTLETGDGNDTVEAGDGHDYVDAGGGEDRIAGGGGDDTLYAGAGDDVVDAGDGRDYVDGFRGDDVLRTGAGHDIVSAGSGADLVASGAGDDVVYTGTGFDVVGDLDGAGVVHLQDEDLAVTGPGMQRVTVEVAAVPGSIRVEGTPQFRARVRADLETLAASPVGQQSLAAIRGGNPSGTLTIRETGEPNGFAVPGDEPGDAGIVYNPSFHLGDPDQRRQVPIGVLQHEAAHAYNFMTGTFVGQDGSSRWYVGPDAAEGPAWDTDGDGWPDRDLDVDDDGRLTFGEVDRDGDGDIDDTDLDINGDGRVNGDDGWLGNEERQAVGLPVDHDGNPDTADVPAETLVPHPPAVTENALRDEMGVPLRPTYK